MNLRVMSKGAGTRSALDFSHCSTFDTGLPQPHEEALRHMKRDPLAPLWLALAFLALILSWLPPVPDISLRP